MTKKIFKYMELIILVTLISGFLAMLFFQYSYFSAVQMRQLRTETSIAAKAVEQEGVTYLESLDLKGTRVTWIDGNGTVLFDNEADASTMTNHSDRPEIRDALEEGTGQSSRYSSTMTTQMLYCAQKLSDGTVLRISESRNTALTVALSMVQPMIWVFLILLLVTWFASSHLSKKIVQPLEQFDLDNPLENEEYPELAPFLHRIYDQQLEITNQKQSLLRAQKDFRSVSDHMEECLILLDEKGRVLTINQQAKKLLHTDESCIGKDILILERRTAFEQAIRRVADGEHCELQLDYSGRVYQADISPVFTGQEMTGMVVLLFDITDRAQAEQLRREFTGNVSHELKTPLHTISGCSELLQSGDVRPQDTRKFAHVIYSETQRMIALVEDILYISHLDEGAADMHWESVDLTEVVNRVVVQLQPEAMKKQITISVTGHAPRIYAVDRLVESIAHNLIDNAIKYNRDAGSVDVRIESFADDVLLTVEDTGIGIPREDQPRIFERFYRVDKSHSREIGGTGLGLSIVRHAAEILHADVEVSSVPGRGSRFTVSFGRDLLMEEL